MGDRGLTATQGDIARRLGLDRSTVSKVLNDAPGAYVGEKTRSRILDMARRLGYDFSRLRRIHRRSAARKPVQIPADVEIVLWDGSRHSRGHATLINLSSEGALLANIHMEPPSIPLKPCCITLDFALPDRDPGAPATAGGGRLRVRADIVRFHLNGFVEIAVDFAGLSEEEREAIDDFTGRRARGKSGEGMIRV